MGLKKDNAGERANRITITIYSIQLINKTIMTTAQIRKVSMKILLLHVFAMGCLLDGTAQGYSARWLSEADTASVPKEIEDPECIGIHKEPAHATLMPYASLTEALKADRHASSFARTLNGTWKFNWVGWPQQRPVDFYKAGYDVSQWKTIRVPSNWQVEGYGTPYYSNFTYIFQKDFPRVMTRRP